MTETTKEIFKKYQIRKNKKQKTAFIEYVHSLAKTHGFLFKTEKGILGARNIIVGDPDTAKVVYTAHYDTCPVLPVPNFITPKNILIYILYQLVILLVLFPVLFVFGLALGIVLGVLTALFELPRLVMLLIELCSIIGIMFILSAGPANKHTANDNTSGVTTLIDIMTDLPEDNKTDVAFVFFDHEELGLLGSMSFASKHKKSMKNKLLVNFDCVSDGENMLFALRRKARVYKDAIAYAFEDCESVNVDIATRGVFYPSDQSNFPCGVGVAALKKSKRLGVLYMDRIHTKKDVIYREENIDYLKNGSIKLVTYLANNR